MKPSKVSLSIILGLFSLFCSSCDSTGELGKITAILEASPSATIVIRDSPFPEQTPIPSQTPDLSRPDTVRETSVAAEATRLSALPTNTSTPDPASRYDVECWETAKTQTEKNRCSGETYENSYRILQELIEELRSRMDDEEWNLFINVQAKWEIFKEADCRFQRVLMEPGTIAPMVQGLCLHERHYQRIQELKIILCGVLGPPDCEAALKY